MDDSGISVTTELDGRDYGPVLEGSGSMIEYLLSTYLLAQRYKLNFFYTPMQFIGHGIHNGIGQKEWDDQWNNYIQKCMLPRLSRLADPKDSKKKMKRISSYEKFIEVLGKTEVPWDLNLNFKQKLHYSNLSFLTDKLDQLRQWYHQNSGHLDGTEFDHDPDLKGLVKDAAIHIRRFTSTDCDPNNVRELYAPGNYMQTFFINVIKSLKALTSNGGPLIQIHIYSQGRESEFLAFLPLGVTLHLDEHPIKTLHQMIKADILVMSKSSFSYVAGIYSRGLKFIKCNPIVPMLPEVRVIPEDGKILKL